MLFKFIKYFRPTNYFNLVRNNNTTTFPSLSDLSTDVLSQLNEDSLFESPEAIQLDLSWQALQKGYIGNAKTINFSTNIPIVDEYRFVRKYMKPIWAFYCLIIRLITLKNPIKEVIAWRKSKDVTFCDYYKNPIKYSNWKNFNSTLVHEIQPKISVIIPTLNRYEYLKDVLEDLENQDYKNFDVIVVDQSEPYNKDFYKNYKIDIKLIHQKEKALWLARNSAIKYSDADYLLLFDDDSRVEKDWVSNHLKCLDFFNADLSSGTSISLVGAKVPENYSFFKISEQLDTGNVLIKRKVFQEIGLFDRQFEGQRMGDGEYGLRSYLAGFLNISNPYAQRLHLKVSKGGLRQMGSWDAFRPKSFLAPRPIPSVLYLFRKYYGVQLTLFSLLNTTPRSIIPYKFKSNKKMLLLGLLISVFIFPLIIYQVVLSWKKATEKLKQGAKIEML